MKEALHALGLNIGNDSLTLDDIKRSYRKMMKNCHPDAGGTEEQSRKVNLAYEFVKENWETFIKEEMNNRILDEQQAEINRMSNTAVNISVAEYKELRDGGVVVKGSDKITINSLHMYKSTIVDRLRVSIRAGDRQDIVDKVVVAKKKKYNEYVVDVSLDTEVDTMQEKEVAIQFADVGRVVTTKSKSIEFLILIGTTKYHVRINLNRKLGGGTNEKVRA